ncbi:MAG: MEDS domain-containing protein [Actinomycetota bacterium]|nr:MEDS domain-containing protein [Actinomycetota bacterium]
MSQLLRPIGSTTHELQLYETDEYLVSSVTDFIEDGLAAGEAGVVIATTQHAIAVEDNLRRRGLDVDSPKADGRYVTLDAAETLSSILVDGAPNPDRFDEVVGTTLARAASTGTGVRAFGELVALLWANDDIAGALRLEELWNDLATRQPFKLLCGYPLRAFDKDPTGAFHTVCELHERVVPTESYIKLPDDIDRLRVVSALQQRVSSSVNERVQRDAENQYRQALELNDTLVQGLSAAKMALELKDYHTLDEVLSDTLQRASAIVSGLLHGRIRNEGLTPGDLRR